MHRWLWALALFAATPAFAQNIKYYVSDTRLLCQEGTFELRVHFDGTGDTIDYTWNDSADQRPPESGTSPVFWTGDQASFNLTNAENGPFTLSFHDRKFHFLHVACSELH